MNDATGLARRYHWHSAAVRDFVSEPHSAIVGENQGTIMNLVDHQSTHAQHAMLTIASEPPTRTIAEVKKLAGAPFKPDFGLSGSGDVPHLTMPTHHELRPSDVDLKRLGAVLAMAYEREFRDFASLLLLENLGPRTVQTLALVAEVVHGTPSRFTDPARFAFALGGKDRHPFPVPLKTYDESIGVLRRSLESAKLGDPDKMDGFRRLDKFVRNIEKRFDPKADFHATVAHENAISKSLDGRSVFDDKPTRPRRKGQLSLFPERDT
jgi:uncharacterized protein